MSPPTSAGDSPSRIAVGQRIVGEIQGDGDLFVDGSVDGSVRIGGVLWIGPHAQVRADVLAGRIRVEGLLEGRVRVAQSVVVAASGKLVGEVHGVLVVEEGGVFRGRLRGELGEPTPAPPPVPGSPLVSASVSSPPSATQPAPASAPAQGAHAAPEAPLVPVRPIPAAMLAAPSPHSAPTLSPPVVLPAPAVHPAPAAVVFEVEGVEPPPRQTAPAAPLPLRPPKLLRATSEHRVVAAPPPSAPTTGRMPAFREPAPRAAPAPVRLDEHSDPRPRATTQPSSARPSRGSSPTTVAPSLGTTTAPPPAAPAARGAKAPAPVKNPAPVAGRAPTGPSNPGRARPTSQPSARNAAERDLDDPWFDAEPE